MDNKNKKIAIIGYGELGRAIHKILENKPGLSIGVWDKKDEIYKLKTVISSAEIIFLCVPSWCVRDAAKNIECYLSKNSLIVSLSKGIESEKMKTMDLVLGESFNKHQPFGLLSGPMLAEEISSGKKGFAVFACKNKKYFKFISEIFKGTDLNIKYSSDLRGVAICGVLKNIYSLGLGICDGLNLGNNTKGVLTSLAIQEMSEMVVEMGGNKKTVFDDAGMSDFIATAFSSFSRNREVGEKLAKTGICCLESEGYKSIYSLVGLLGNKYKKFWFLSALKSIVLDKKDCVGAFSELLNSGI